MCFASDTEVLESQQTGYMTPEHLEYFRKKLLSMYTELAERGRQTANELHDGTIVEPDPLDRAAQEEQFALDLRARDRERKLLDKIKLALRAIEDGSYGYCHDTGEEIGLARLLIRPTALLSVEAQQRREILKKTQNF